MPKLRMPVITPEEFKTKMGEFNTGDIEADHSNADDLMCLVLRRLGYAEGVEIFEKMEKWYA